MSDNAIPPSSTPEEIAADVQALRTAFRAGVLRDRKARKTQLLALRRLLTDNLDAICVAVEHDLHKNPTETRMTETNFVLGEIQEHLDYLDDWSAPEPVSTNVGNLPGKAMIYKDPLGVVCVISTWNYPVQLSLLPLVGAISAGNVVLLRLPGDDTSVRTNALLAKLIAQYMDPSVVRTVHGGVDASKAMLEQKFDLIFCTGGEFIGKIVAAAAAKHLTPTVLELGGKSPSIVDETSNIAIAARRIAWGSFLNAGQTCVRPDYVLVHRSVGDQLVAAIERECVNFFGADAKTSDSYCRIVNERMFTRVEALITKDAKYVSSGGATDAKDRFIAPTLLNYKTDLAAFEASATMSQEIFGPLVPVYYYDSLDDAIAFVNIRPKPLALYVFTTNATNREKVLTQTSSGNVTVNDTLMHMSNPALPFGGVGNSGMGAYHGKFSFDTFTHRKGVQVKYNVLDAPQRYPPYSVASERVLALLLKPIPRSTLKTLKLLAFAALIAFIGVVVKRVGLPQFQ